MAAERALLPTTVSPTLDLQSLDALGQFQTPQVASFSARLLCQGDRRMEAECYLTSGYGLRLAIEAQQDWNRLSDFAKVWQPSRLKGIQVSPSEGTPFLAATQVFDLRPMPRKWLALERTQNFAERFVKSGTFLVTCSGNVGRVTMAGAPHTETLISHDLLRVEPKETAQSGWVYAYLRAPQVRAMMSSAQYGHIIKHLEVGHLNALPIPLINEVQAELFTKQVAAILEARNQAHALTLEAEARFERALGIHSPNDFCIEDWGENGYSTRASSLWNGRRRLEGAFHNPGVNEIRHFLRERGKGFSTLLEAGFDVWVPGRYKRIPAVDGVNYYDSANILEVCPQPSKRFADCEFGDRFNGRVQQDWLLMPSSGQIYGIIGSVTLAGLFFNGQVVSNHVIRIAPTSQSQIRVGYITTVLSHSFLGKPMIKALAFGSSVPEITPNDIASCQFIRLGIDEESIIADLAEEAAHQRGLADSLERALSEEAGTLLDRFIAGHRVLD